MNGNKNNSQTCHAKGLNHHSLFNIYHSLFIISLFNHGVLGVLRDAQGFSALTPDPKGATQRAVIVTPDA